MSMNESEYRQKIREDMESLGVYKSEYSATINELARMYVELDTARETFTESGASIVMAYTNRGGETNTIKNPAYQVIEGLQQRILTYNKELGLTPQGYRRLTNADANIKPVSALAKALQKLDS